MEQEAQRRQKDDEEEGTEEEEHGGVVVCCDTCSLSVDVTWSLQRKTQMLKCQ